MSANDLNVKRYVGVQHDLLSYVAEHNLTSGDKLPNEGEIARMFAVSITTVRRALHDLRKAGLLETEQRYRTKGGKSSLLYKIRSG